MFRFFLSLIAATGMIALTVYIGVNLGYFTVPSFFYQTLILLTLTSAILFSYLFKAQVAIFVQLYLATTVLKLIIYIGYNLLMILHDKESTTENVVFFMVVYALFTALEIAFLYRRISGQDRP